ncbi:MAG: LysR family transcriptional regulator [Pseudomonadota bacterium]
MYGQLPPLPWLRSFEAAARHLSFTAAAEELHVTQSAVSQQVRNLEAFLGQRLFVRSPRSMGLTEAGYAYLPGVQGAFKLIAETTTAFVAPKPQQALDIRSNTAFTILWLMPRIGGFLDRHPEIEIDLATVLWASDFRGSPASVEVRYGQGQMDGVASSERLVKDRLIPLCAPAMANRLKRPDDLAKVPLIHLAAAFDSWSYWGRALGITSVRDRSGHVLNSNTAILELARQGYGVALGYELLARDMMAKGELVAPFDLAVPAQDNLYLVISKTARDSAAAQAFRLWLFQALKDGNSDH